MNPNVFTRISVDIFPGGCRQHPVLTGATDKEERLYTNHSMSKKKPQEMKNILLLINYGIQTKPVFTVIRGSHLYFIMLVNA